MTDLAVAPSSAAPRHLTTSQALADHDANMRAAAASAGAPVDRTAMGGLRLAGTMSAIIYMAKDALHYLDMGEVAVPTRLDPAALWTLVSEAYDLVDADPDDPSHAPIVFADRDTLRRTIKFAERLAKEKGTVEARGVARLLAYRNNLPFSVFSPILTEALASRYWLPTEADPDDLSDWHSAFSPGKRVPARNAFGSLIARASDGRCDEKIMKAIIGAERYGARAAQYGSSHAQCSAFSKAGILTDAHATLLNLDPVLRARNAIEGTVTTVHVVDANGEEITATISGEPGKLREATKVLLFDEAGRTVEVLLRRLDFSDDDELTAVMAPPAVKAAHGSIIAQSATDSIPLYLTLAPFLMVKRSPKNRRWTEGGEPRNLPIDMPADIALAGAPTSD